MTAQRLETWLEFARWLLREAGWHERRNFLMLVTVMAAVVAAVVWVLVH